MSEAIHTGLVRRLRYTPLRDLLRMRVSGRLDVAALLAQAELPEPAKVLIADVIARTRLTRLEKSAVARELIAHFADAVDAGVSIEESIRSFGNPKQAAKLVRRAKIRNRSVVSSGIRWVGRAIAILFLAYIGLGIYYFSGKASPSVDYMSQMNARTRATPVERRAWPIYRQAAATAVTDPLPDSFDLLSPDWPSMKAWLGRHPGTPELIRRGASMPLIGLEWKVEIDPADVQLLAEQPSAATPGVPMLFQARMIHYRHVRTLARVLAADASAAVETGEGERVASNIHALLSLSEQMADEEMLISHLVGIGIRLNALRAASIVMERDPALLSDSQWLDLVHRLALTRTAADVIHFKGERIAFHDFVQHTYTDNGHADGRIAPNALTLMQSLTAPRAADSDERLVERALGVAASPALLMVSASRKELIEEYDRYINTVEARLPRPLRELGDDPEARLIQLKQNLMTSVRFTLLTTFAPALGRTQASAERMLGVQDGLTVRIAIELYRREMGSYPKSLSELTPRYLPAIPADRIDGQPLRYRLVDGNPIVYSVGVDRDDDGGRAPKPQFSKQVAEWGGPIHQRVDGDWVLFPYMP